MFYFKALQFTRDKYTYIEILYNIAIIYDEMDIPEKALMAYNKIAKINEKEAGGFLWNGYYI